MLGSRLNLSTEPKGNSIRPVVTQASRNRPTMVDHPQGSVSARTAVALEYASLRHVNHCPTGMYVVPSTENLLIWDAVFFVHQGYYGDAIFKFRLKFPENYPEQPPEVYFVTDVFHPLVGQNGLLNLSVRFKPWRPKEHHVFDVLHWIKAAFKKHALDQIKEGDCLNKEAFRYHDSTQSFAALATQSALLSQSESALFDRDHPSMTGTAHEGIVFHKMKKNDLAKERAQLDLQEWSDPVQK